MLSLVFVTRNFFREPLYVVFRAFSALLCVFMPKLFFFFYLLKLNWMLSIARLTLFGPISIRILCYGLLFGRRFVLTRLFLQFLELELLCKLLLLMDRLHPLLSHSFPLFSGWRLINFDLAMSDVFQFYFSLFLLEFISSWNMLLSASDRHRLRHLASFCFAKDCWCLAFIAVVIFLCRFLRGASQTRWYALDL